MKQPISTLYRMDTLLQECKTCERRLKNPAHLNPDKVCGGCDIYSQLRKIGDELEGRTKMGNLKEFTVEEYNDLKAKGLNDEQICEEVGVSSLHYWKKKNGLIGTTLRSENKTITAVITPSETKNPQPEKQQPNNELQELVGTLKRKLEVREMAIKQKEEEYDLLKENTVPLGEYTTMKRNYEDAEGGRQLYMHKYRQEEERYQQTFSNLEKTDHEHENTKEQLRKVRDYNVKATEKIQHLEALLMMYMGEGEQNV
jgi:hypothetical protein